MSFLKKIVEKERKKKSLGIGENWFQVRDCTLLNFTTENGVYREDSEALPEGKHDIEWDLNIKNNKWNLFLFLCMKKFIM